jgi:HEAT repeat protein
MLGASRETLIVLKLLYDDVAFVRVHAVKALAGFNQPDFAGSLRTMLADPEWRVRLAAREALVSLDRSALASPAARFRDASRFMAAGLGSLHDPVVQPGENRREKLRRQPGPDAGGP